MIFHKGRTKRYLGTIRLDDQKDLAYVASLRSNVKEVNDFYSEKGSKSRFYIKLQGRGPRLGNLRYNQSLPLSFAETADVYMYER